MAELIYPILVKLAPRGKTITYKGMSDLVKEHHPNVPGVSRLHHRHIGRRLGTIWRFTDKYGYPHIGSLVVNKDSGECGRGVTEILDPVVERKKVKAFDWLAVDIGFDKYLTKTKSEQTDRERKLVKRTYDQAKELFFDFWPLVKDTCPVTSKIMAEIRKKLIELVQNGHSPASAYSIILLDFLNKGMFEKEPVEGVVYIGEYRDIESDQPLFDQVKIGFTTKSLDERAAALSGGVLGPLRFVMTYAWKFEPGHANVVEQYLHGAFDSYRKKGEFFLSLEGLIEEWSAEKIDEMYSDVSEPILIDGEAVG